jgi:hypothetical protein
VFYNRPWMHSARLVLLLSAAVACSGCFHMTTVLKANGDGSGTIEHTMLFTTAAVNQLKQLAMFRGGNGQDFDPLSEQQARDMATVIGQGVTYVSSTPVATAIGQGREALYAFSDVNQLKIATQPPTPAGVTVRPPGSSADAESVSFSLTREANGNAVLHIHVPEPNWLSAVGSASASGQLAMIKTLLAGAQIQIAVEPAGTLVGTSSTYADSRRVTLLELDLDEMMRDDTLLPRLAAARSQDELSAVARSARGLKINLDREITIEFTPEK